MMAILRRFLCGFRYSKALQKRFEMGNPHQNRRSIDHHYEHHYNYKK